MKAEIKTVNICGETPLIHVSHDYVEIVKLLLAAGAKKDKITTSGETSLTLATERGHHKIVQLLQ